VNSKVIARAITALVGIPVLVLIIGWSPPWNFSLLVFLVTVVSLHEYGLIIFAQRRKDRILTLLLGGLVALGVIVPDFRAAGEKLAALLAIAFAVFCLSRGSWRERYAALGWILLGALYVGYLVPHFVPLYEFPYGKQWVFWLLLVVMTGDTAAYIVGSSIGKRKLSPKISPGKTVEGALASAGMSLCIGVIGGRLLLPQLPMLEMFGLALILSLLGQGGDLFESWLKRLFSVKDSGALLPGHGGLLDRIDSLIFPVVFTTYYVRLFH
jgi:phosphatidate cytidylyltransferase